MRGIPILLLLGLCASGLRAAELETTAGQVHRGTIVAEDEGFVTFAMRQAGTTMQIKLPKRVVHRLRDTADGDWRIITPKPARKPPEPEPEPAIQEPEPDPLPPPTTEPFGWRGDHSGVFPDADPPLHWSATENRVWTLPLNEKSNASVVLATDRVFACEEPNTLICIDRATGAELWRRTNSIADAGATGEPHSTKWVGTYGWTTPTPVTYGHGVWASFGNGVVACYDLEGDRQWIKKVHVDGHAYMTAASPCLIDDLFVCYMARKDWVGTYYAFHATTGELAWEQVSRIQQGSLIPLQLDGRSYVLASCGTIFDAATGDKLKERWWGKKGRNWGPTAVWDRDARSVIFPVYDGTREGTKPMIAFALDPTGPTRELWRYDSDPEPHYGGRMYGSPVLHDGVFYGARKDGHLFALDASDGTELYTAELPGNGFCSLAVAGAYVYITGKQETTILRAGRTYDEVARFAHDLEKVRSSPVFAGTRMYIRDRSGVHCIGR